MTTKTTVKKSTKKPATVAEKRGRGRPKKDVPEGEETVIKSIGLPARYWENLQEIADKDYRSINRQIQLVLDIYFLDHAAKLSKT